MIYLEIRKRERNVIRLAFSHIDYALRYLKMQSIIKDVRLFDSSPIEDGSKFSFVE